MEQVVAASRKAFAADPIEGYGTQVSECVSIAVAFHQILAEIDLPFGE